MDTKKLRQKILDLAIRGKLVPQDPNDEPASVLLERIRAEKERLIKEGKIKRSKKSASDDNIEALFEIPESWEWTTIGDIFQHNTGKALNKSDFAEGELHPYLTTSNVYWNTFDFTEVKEMHFKTSELGKCTVIKGDLLVCEGGDIGRAAIWSYDYNICIQNHIHRLRAYGCISHSLYLYYLMLYKWTDRINGQGIGLQGLSSGILDKLRVPLPPLTEQKRITNEIKRWFSVIDELESNKDDLLKAIDKAKSKILDLAIHGKLVPQDPNDEPAIELLKRINPKFEPCKNELYDTQLPDSWCCARGTDIFEPMKSTQPSGKTFKYIDIDAIDNKLNIITSVKVLSSKDAPSRASRYTEKGCVLFSMVRPYLRNIAIVPEENCIASTGFYVCKSKEFLDSRFCLYMMLSDYVVYGLNEYMKGDNSPSINKRHIDSFTFPLPPYLEQLRIVSKIEELFAVLDGIKESLA